ncbi:MAG: sigma-70 family RNA polymerase sigma factor [Methyloligellaceae bacterium]
MVQIERQDDSIRYRLISLLPRLRRFCAVLAGDRQGRDSLLRRACLEMIGGGTPPPRGEAFDKWAFAKVYATWLDLLRSHDAPIAQGRGNAALFEAAFRRSDAQQEELVDLATSLARLPPQQRCALLLLYGEGFSHEEAAGILDIPVSDVSERALRALSALIDREGARGSETGGTAGIGADNVESLFPGQRRAG